MFTEEVEACVFYAKSFEPSAAERIFLIKEEFDINGAENVCKNKIDRLLSEKIYKIYKVEILFKNGHTIILSKSDSNNLDFFERFFLKDEDISFCEFICEVEEIVYED
jgi:hypothetical protein